jgi:hypothetical protein
MKSFVSRSGLTLSLLQSAALLVLFAPCSVTAWAQAGPGASHPETPTRGRATPAGMVANYGDVPLAFELNQGQAESGVRFAARAKGLTVLLSDREIELAVGTGDKAKLAALRMSYVAAAFQKKPVALDKQEGISNYLLGSDPTSWITGIANFGRVEYAGIYPGVDLVFYGNHQKLEHDFTVAPGADYRQIRVRLNGADGLRVDKDGTLRVITEAGELTFQPPDIYQAEAQGRVAVGGHYVVTAENEFGFELGAYDKRLPVVIDPVLSYSTYLAGSGNDTASAITVDAKGNAYITGYTVSADFPLKHPKQATCSNGCGPQDVFVTKLNATGSALVYSTFVGGTGGDQGNAIAVDSLGNATVVGTTSSFDFPQKNGMAVVLSSFATHGFAFSLTPAGTVFNFSTYLGGDSQDSPTGVAVDGNSNVYVSGYTSSTNFPVTNQIGPVPTQFGGNDVFLVKLSLRGKLAFSTLVGGVSSNYNSTFPPLPVAAAVDAGGEAVLSGSAYAGFPTTAGSFQPNYSGNSAGTNVFICKFNATGTAFLDATYLGGGGGDTAAQVVLDATGNVYLAGTTYSVDFPISIRTFQRTHGQGGLAGFVTKMDPTLSTLMYSTYLRGTLKEFKDVLVSGLAVDDGGNAYVAGTSGLASFPMVSPLQSQPPQNEFGQGSGAAFLAVLNATGTRLTFSTYFAGSTGTGGAGVAVDHAAHALITGGTQDSDLPTTHGAFQATIPPNVNFRQHGFVAEFLMTTANASVCLADDQVVLTSIAGNPSSPAPLSVSNCGTLPLTITGTTVSNPVFSVQSGSCSAIAPGATCNLQVVYTPSPTSNYGDSGTLEILDNAPISSSRVILTGHVERPITNIFDNAFNFGDAVIGMTTAPLYAPLMNVGNLPLHISAVTGTGDFSGVNQCPSVLLPGKSCRVGATFTPAIIGPDSGSVLVYDDAPGSPQSISLVGNGLAVYPAPTELFLSPNLAPAGPKPVSIYVSGIDIFPTSTVNINGRPFTGKVVSLVGALQFALPGAMLKQLGTLSIQVVNPAPGGASAPILFSVYRQTTLGAADMVFEPFTQKFYASIPAASAANPNTLITVDPNTGKTGAPIPIGNDPGALGLSDDGQILYVALNGDNAIVPFNLATQTSGAEIPLGSDPAQGPLHAIDIQVQPGNPGTVVATVSASGYYGSDGVILIENGKVVSEYLNDAPNSVAVGGTRFAGTSDVYGWESNFGSYGLLHFVIEGNQLLEAPGIPANYGVGPFDIIGTSLFDTDGQVFSSNGSLVGTIANLGGTTGVLADAASNRLFFLNYGAIVYDATALTPVGNVAGPSASTSRIQKWGATGLAYLGSQTYPGQDLVQLSSNLFTPSPGPNPVPAVAALSPSTVISGGSNFVLTITGSQFVAGAVVQWNGSNRTTRFVDGGTLMVDIPASDIAVSGTAKITVANPAPAGGKSPVVKLGIS